MDHYFDEVNSRWKKVSVEIKSVQSMLEEVIESWKRYNACVDLLTVWLSDGEKMMSRSTEEKQVHLNLVARKPALWFPTRSDTNYTVQS